MRTFPFTFASKSTIIFSEVPSNICEHNRKQNVEENSTLWRIAERIALMEYFVPEIKECGEVVLQSGAGSGFVISRGRPSRSGSNTARRLPLRANEVADKMDALYADSLFWRDVGRTYHNLQQGWNRVIYVPCNVCCKGLFARISISRCLFVYVIY